MSKTLRQRIEMQFRIATRLFNQLTLAGEQSDLMLNIGRFAYATRRIEIGADFIGDGPDQTRQTH